MESAHKQRILYALFILLSDLIKKRLINERTKQLAKLDLPLFILLSDLIKKRLIKWKTERNVDLDLPISNILEHTHNPLPIHYLHTKFRSISEVNVFQTSPFFFYSFQFILALILLTILLLHTNSLLTLLTLYHSIWIHLILKNFLLTATNNTTHYNNFTLNYSFYTTILYISYTFKI